jgi:hypothetical protein
MRVRSLSPIRPPLSVLALLSHLIIASISNSKKHHYVPEAHLRNFSRVDDPDQIWVFDKLRSRKFSSAIRDAGSEGNYNAIEVDGKKVNLEPIFDRVDNFGAPLIKSILQAQRIDHLNPEERHKVTLVVAVQIVRAKIHRLSFAHIMEQLGESARNRGWDPEEFANFGIPTEMESKIISFRSLDSVDDLAAALGSKICVLHKVDAPSVLWISDNPVVTFNSFPYSDQGINSPGVEIYYPLSFQFLLAFYCPSIGGKPGGTVSSFRVQPCERILFSRGDDSGPSTLGGGTRARPRWPNGRVPRRERMPSGTHLVIIGESDHAMLPVESWRNEPEGAEFEVTVLSSRIPDDLRREESIVTASVFKDGYEVRMSRNVVLEFKDDGEFSAIRVRFLDEDMNNLSTLASGSFAGDWLQSSQ